MTLTKKTHQISVLALTISSLFACGGSNNNSVVSTPPASVVPADTSPDPFEFSPQFNVLPDIMLESTIVTITGITAQTSVAIEGGEYAIDTGDYTADSGMVENGQQIKVRLRSSGDPGATTSATLTVGDHSTVFTITSRIENEDPTIIEAEFATLQGNATMTENLEASNGWVVDGFSTELDAVVFHQTPESVAVRITYNGSNPANVNLYLGGEMLRSVVVPVTGEGEFKDIIAALDIPEGAELAMGSDETEGDWQLDKIQWIDFPLQQVRTIANSGVLGGDGLSVSAEGDLYVSGGLGAGEIVKVDQQGQVSTFASGLVSANGSDFDSVGNLYVADYYGNSVHKITPDGERSLFAENLDGPSGLYVDQKDNIIVAQYGAGFSGTAATVLQFTPGGERSILASGGGLMDVIGVVGDEQGNIYAGNWFSGELYQITGGQVTLLADLDVTINMIDFARGYIYIGNSGVISRVSVDGSNEVFSGTSEAEAVDGPVAQANFVNPVAVAFATDNNTLYVYDGSTGNIRSISFAD